MARQINVELTGDSRDFQQSMSKAGGATDDFQKKTRLSNDSIAESSNKFRGTADTLDGLTGVMGAAGVEMDGLTGQALMAATGFADLAEGFGEVVGPALTKLGGKIKNLTFVTKAQTIAQRILNAVMKANPILKVIAIITLLVGAFVLAYKNSETFRRIVQGAWKGIRRGVEIMWDVIRNVFGKLKNLFLNFTAIGLLIKHFGTLRDAATGVARAIRRAFQTAFGAIKSAWNATVGGFGIDIPGFLGFGGISFRIPELARGGVARAGMPHIVGERGPELFVPGVTGRVVPNNRLGGGMQTVRVVLDVTGSDSEMKQLIRKMVRVNGGNVQTAFGTAA